MCQEGYTGTKCNLCSEGYFSAFGGECVLKSDYLGFSQSGNVSVSKNNIAYTIQNYGPEFYVEFKLKIHKEPPNGWTNILHVTDGSNIGAHGNRFPALFLWYSSTAKYFSFTTTINDNVNYVHNANGVKLNHNYHIIISQTYNKNEKLMYNIVIDDELVHSVENTNPISVDVVQVYLSDPWYASIGDIGELYDISVLTNAKGPTGE